MTSTIPRAAVGTVSRPRLDQLLDRGRDYPVTLICAPAGSGKSIAASAWARRREGSPLVAWMACSSLAGDPGAFWSSAIAALTKVVGPDPAAPALPTSLVPTDRSEFLEALLTWLAELPSGTTLIVDDFGEVGAAATQRELQYVLDRLPDQVSLMILTRSYPPLAVHRARLEGRLLDIRGSDLAFSREECAALLAVHELEVDAADLDLLHRRTEGWAAGLRLAVTSMLSAADPSDVIHRLAASSDVVSGYLTEQVLAQLSPADRDFLLDTCVVAEVTADLVAVLSESQKVVDLDEAAGRVGFLTATAESGTHFRFHPLFAELLRTELRHSDPERYRRQHRRAARWFEIRGETVLAIRHAQAAEDWDRAARLLALDALSLVLRGRMPEVIALLKDFPQDVAATDPRLALVQAIPTVFGNDPARGRMLLERAQAGLPPGRDLDTRRLAAITCYVSTIIARYVGDTSAVLAALDPRGPDVPGPDDSGFVRSDLDLRATWRATRAVSLMWEDDSESALTEARRAGDDVRAGAAGWPMIAALGVRAWLSALDGHLNVVDQLIEQLAPYVSSDAADSPYLALTDFAEVWVAMERGQLDLSEAVLARAEARLNTVNSSGAGVTDRILRARLMLLNGGPSAATDMLDSAYERGPGLRRGLLRRLEAWVRVEILLSRGEVPDAAEGARNGSPALRAYVLARSGGAPLADMVWDDRELGLQLRTLLTHAINLHQAGRRQGADQCLDAVLQLTAAEGYRLPFLQLGVRAHALLIDGHVSAAHHGSLVAELLRTTAPSAGRGADLTDPLSPRELDVLRHLVAGMDTDEIAGDLFVSRNTVRTHTKSIYRKLAVQNKRDALLRASALGIV